MFSQRHYKAIAEWLKAMKPNVEDTFNVHPMAFIQWEMIVNKFVDEFKRDNPKFKEHLFRKSLGQPYNVWSEDE